MLGGQLLVVLAVAWIEVLRELELVLVGVFAVVVAVVLVVVLE